jgi:diguanylate cyclase (GGDEF)-like protein
VSSGDQDQIRSVLTLIRDLSGTRPASVAELFTQSFAALHATLPFDLGAAILLETNLDLHIVTRAGFEALVNDRFIEEVRLRLQNLIPASFTAADIVVKSETHNLPSRPAAGDCLANEEHVVVNVGHRTAGLFLFFRCEAFTEFDGHITEIFSATMAMLLGQLDAQERMRNLADTDDLTGIWNKRYFRRHLPQELERARIYGVPLALLMLDVDDFKDINDNYGHTAGDVVLSELCGAVRESLRPPDLFARFGGDEFSIVLPHTDLAGACAVADRILHKVREMVIPNGGEGVLTCSVSIGLAEFRPGDDVASLIRRADERLYASKREGKNRYTASA